MDDDPSAGRRPTGGGDDGNVVSVYVLDDHHYVREMLVELIDASEGMMVVGSCESAPEAIAEVARLRPRVAVVDGQVGDRSGLDVCRELKTASPEVSCVIMTSAVGSAWGPTEAAEAGAVAYVVKQIRHFELVDVIRRVATGSRPIDDDESANELPS